MTYKYRPQTKSDLLSCIANEIYIQGDAADLNCIDTSCITDMSNIFQNSQFNGDISKWNASNVTDMGCMFHNSKFNGDISGWNTGKVMDMLSTFSNSRFNGDISIWDVGQVIDMEKMFGLSLFNGDISCRDVSNVVDMVDIFENSYFIQNIWGWNLKSINSDSLDYINGWRQRHLHIYERVFLNAEIPIPVTQSSQKMKI